MRFGFRVEGFRVYELSTLNRDTLPIKFPPKPCNNFMTCAGAQWTLFLLPLRRRRQRRQRDRRRLQVINHELRLIKITAFSRETHDTTSRLLSMDVKWGSVFLKLTATRSHKMERQNMAGRKGSRYSNWLTRPVHRNALI